MGRRSDIDWEAVEADYRIGRLTLVAMEAKHGVRRESIVRRMKRLGIKRDLSEHVRAAARAKVLAREVEKKSTESAEKVKSAIDAAAEVAADVVDEHKSSLVQLRELWHQVLDEVRSITAARRAGVTHEQVESIASAVGLSPEDVRAVIESSALHTRVAAIDKLANVISKVVPLERRTHGLDDESSYSSPWEDNWRKLAAEYYERPSMAKEGEQ